MHLIIYNYCSALDTWLTFKTLENFGGQVNEYNTHMYMQ